MLQRLLFLAMLLPVLSWAKTSTEMSWLDNRFRVDPTVEQVSFIVQREIPSSSVVLVRPDGTKYYSWRHPENLSWYEESGMDIISIENPMPGPWQAIGKVASNNQVRVLSNLKLDVDNLPSRLYQSETLKFTARLTNKGELLMDRDFIDRIKLTVVLYEYVESVDTLPKEAQPQPIVIGEFSDDGIGFDERPGDGVFTVALPIDVLPGKYRVKIASRNGIFLRTVEQEVLIYPPPMTVSFIQGRDRNEAHQLAVTTEKGALVPGSLAAHVEQESPDGNITISQGHAIPDEDGLRVTIPNGQEPGGYSWSGWLYATDNLSGRELIFSLPKSHFAVLAELQLDQNLELFRSQQEAKALAIEQKRLDKERKAARSKALKIMMISNTVVILLVIIGVILWRKRQFKKALEKESLVLPTEVTA